MEQQQRKKEPSAFEKHFQTAMQVILVSLLLSGVTKLQSISDRLIMMEARDQQKKEQIDAVQAATNRIQVDMNDLKDRMTRVEANQNSKK